MISAVSQWLFKKKKLRITYYIFRSALLRFALISTSFATKGGGNCGDLVRKLR